MPQGYKNDGTKLVPPSNLGKHHSEETKRKIGNSNEGKKHSEEFRKRISERQKGRILSEETKEKIRNGNKGKVMSEEAKRKISEANKGKKLNYPIWNKGKRGLQKPSEETRKRMSESHKGKKSHFWRGGLTENSFIIRNSFEYKLWRTAVFERDNYTCIWCGVKSGNGKTIKLNADHIKPFCDYPELRFAIDNGRTLCENCHRKTNTFAGRIKSYDTGNKVIKIA